MAGGRDFIGPFQLIRLIRSGNTTQVWEAIREGEKERVALKLLHKEFAKDKEQIEQLKHETLVAQSLDHPNIIKIYGYHGEYGVPFISMQLFNARNLKLELRDRPEFVEINLPAIVRRSAEALAHVHEKGWIHCDIKPDNFLADEQANLKLIDFSIAQKWKSGFSLFGTRQKVVRGTRSYISPEQIRRQKLDQRADIYSYGCVLYELSSAKLPFTAANADDLLNKHLRAPVPSLQAADNRITAEFATLVMRMLSKKPEGRPNSMRDFLLEFQRVQIYRAGARRRHALNE